MDSKLDALIDKVFSRTESGVLEWNRIDVNRYKLELPSGQIKLSRELDEDNDDYYEIIVCKDTGEVVQEWRAYRGEDYELLSDLTNLVERQVSGVDVVIDTMLEDIDRLTQARIVDSYDPFADD
jgi:hypothetical protein